MASINSTLALQDKMSGPMLAITKAMNSGMAAMRGIEGVKLGPEFAQMSADIKLAEQAINQMNNELLETPSATQKAAGGFTVMKGVAVHAISAIARTIKDELVGGLDSAFKRIDTMERFNRTMTIFTGSAEVAASTLEDVRDSVIGTAYGLDTAAKAAQGFITSGLDPTNATRQLKTLTNAVSLYMEGTNEELKSVTETWQKIQTQGKATTQYVNSLALAGIPVWELYSEKMGISVDAMRGALSKGEISAEKFQSTVISALEEGTTTFASAEGAAKAAGASWGGTFANMGAAVTRGMQSIVESIDSSLEAMGLPKMRAQLESVGLAAETALKGLASGINAILPAAIGIVSTLTAYLVITNATKIATAAYNVLLFTEGIAMTIMGFATANATMAMQGLNMVMAASPIGLLAIVIGIVTMMVYKWIQSVGGIKVAWAIAKDFLLTTWESIQIKFAQFKDAILGHIGTLKVSGLLLLQGFANGAIGIINKLIENLNKIHGVSIEAIAQVTFGAEAAASENARRVAAKASMAELERTTAINRSIRTLQLSALKAESAADKAGAGADLSGAFDDYSTGSGAGKALKTNVTNDVSIDSEDIKMLLDIATRGYQVHYQTLTPSIAVNIDTVRETADVNQIINIIADEITEMADASLVYG